MPKPKLVILLNRFPFPLEKGDKLRAYHQIKELHPYFEIYLYCLSFSKVNWEHQQELEPYTKSIRIFYLSKFTAIINFVSFFLRNLPMQNGLFYNANIKKTMQQEWQIVQPDIVFVQLQRIAAYVDNVSYKKVLDFQDAFSLNYERSALQTKWPKSLFYRMEQKRVAVIEQALLRQFDATTIISKRDRDAISNKGIRIVPNGVDMQYFVKKHVQPEYDLVFVGNLGYLPNELAVRWIVEQLIPALEVKQITVKILIAGASPTAYIKEINNPLITVSPWLPDIRDAYANGKVFIAPLFSGAGLQNKVLEALSMEMPCVVTDIVNLSIGALPNQHLVVATDVNAFVEAIETLLKDDAKCTQLGKQGRIFIEANYSWAKNTAPLVQLLQGLL